MDISMSTRQAYSEVYEFLSLLSVEERNKIPKELLELFEKERDFNYNKIIEPNKPIKDQNLMEETLAIIALLNLKYWCDNEQEKQRLKDIYARNEKIYQEAFQVEFDSNKSSNKGIKTNQLEENKNYQLTTHKESLLVNVLKHIFGKSG